jgi:hypothetical protein
MNSSAPAPAVSPESLTKAALPSAPAGPHAPTFCAVGIEELRLAARAWSAWLWQGYLAPGNVTLLTSQWKSGKTALLAVLLARLQAGGLLAGLPLRPGKAAVVSEESAAHWACRGQRLDLGGHVWWLCRPFPGKPRPQEWLALVDYLAALAAQRGLDLVVIDPLASFLPGQSDNNIELNESSGKDLARSLTRADKCGNPNSLPIRPHSTGEIVPDDTVRKAGLPQQ